MPNNHAPDLKEINAAKSRRELHIRSVDESARTVELSFSSDIECQRSWGYEILSHKPSDVDLSRMNERAPLLMDHDTRDQIGVVERAWLDGDKARAVVRFSKSARGDGILKDVKDGVRCNVSVGYNINNMEYVGDRDGEPVYRVTDWMPYEISIVSVPADTTVGVGRAFRAATPPKKPAGDLVDLVALIKGARSIPPYKHDYDGNGAVSRSYPQKQAITRALTVNDILPHNAGTDSTIGTVIAQQSLVARAGVQVIPTSVANTPPDTLTSASRIVGQETVFVAMESGVFTEITEDGQEVKPSSTLPYTIMKHSDDDYVTYALRYELSRKQIKHELGLDTVAAVLSRAFEWGINNVIDLVMLAGIKSKATSLTDVTFKGLAKVATARGLRFGELRAFAGGDLTALEQAVDGSLIACGVPCETTNQTDSTLFAATNRMALWLFDDIYINCSTNSTLNGGMAFTLFMSLNPAIPDTTVCWIANVES